jgi:hypothetical protein
VLPDLRPLDLRLPDLDLLLLDLDLDLRFLGRDL